MKRGILSGLLAVLLLAGAPGSAVLAKDIKLGGDDHKPKLPKTVVVLPRISVAIQSGDGGWRHIAIDAYLAGTDENNAKELEAKRNIIIGKADQEFPNRNFEILQSAVEGSIEAKKVIHAAVEAGLGREWKGEVMIRNMLVY